MPGLRASWLSGIGIANLVKTIKGNNYLLFNKNLK
jgi:hypothetical protein